VIFISGTGRSRHSGSGPLTGRSPGP
jgi:hypothetical protein